LINLAYFVTKCYNYEMIIVNNININLKNDYFKELLYCEYKGILSKNDYNFVK